MRLNEHDPEYGAFMLNLDDFECRQQRKFGRKLSHLRSDAVLFFAKLKLKAQAKARHLDDHDLQWELNAVADKMAPRVRRRDLPTWDGYMSVYSDVFAYEDELREHIPSKRQAKREGLTVQEQQEQFNQMYKGLMTKLAAGQHISDEEVRAAIEAFMRCMTARGQSVEAALIMMDELFADLVEQIQSQNDPEPTADYGKHLLFPHEETEENEEANAQPTQPEPQEDFDSLCAVMIGKLSSRQLVSQYEFEQLMEAFMDCMRTKGCSVEEVEMIFKEMFATELPATYRQPKAKKLPAAVKYEKVSSALAKKIKAKSSVKEEELQQDEDALAELMRAKGYSDDKIAMILKLNIAKLSIMIQNSQLQSAPDRER